MTQTNAAASLIGLFHGTVATKKSPYGKPDTPAKIVGVLGAGLMGAGIGQVSAMRGHNVLLKGKLFFFSENDCFGLSLTIKIYLYIHDTALTYILHLFHWNTLFFSYFFWKLFFFTGSIPWSLEQLCMLVTWFYCYCNHRNISL